MSKKEKLSIVLLRLYLSGEIFNFSTYQTLASQSISFASRNNIFLQNAINFVAFTSKSDLVEYYKEKLNAGVFRDRRMYIDENAAQVLLDKYMRK